SFASINGNPFPREAGMRDGYYIHEAVFDNGASFGNRNQVVRILHGVKTQFHFSSGVGYIYGPAKTSILPTGHANGPRDVLAASLFLEQVYRNSLSFEF